MIELYAALVRHCIDAHDLDVVLIAMEELDETVCQKILATVGGRYGERITLASSRTLTPYQMVPLLRRLDYLVTARYHACVLSMANAVPQMALCHDDRLPAIYTEMGMTGFLLYHDDQRLETAAPAIFDELVRRRSEVAARLRKAYETHYVPTCRENRRLLQSWVETHLRPRPEHVAASARLLVESNNGR
jgi:polysaccharide pyruvyl transferase WcaK-like protein